jgi:hypothetical protein
MEEDEYLCCPEEQIGTCEGCKNIKCREWFEQEKNCLICGEENCDIDHGGD